MGRLYNGVGDLVMKYSEYFNVIILLLKNWYFCLSCAERVGLGNLEFHLKKHKKVSTGHSCDVCKIGFSSEDRLNFHYGLRGHTRTVARQASPFCVECGVILKEGKSCGHVTCTVNEYAAGFPPDEDVKAPSGRDPRSLPRHVFDRLCSLFYNGPQGLTRRMCQTRPICEDHFSFCTGFRIDSKIEGVEVCETDRPCQVCQCFDILENRFGNTSGKSYFLQSSREALSNLLDFTKVAVYSKSLPKHIEFHEANVFKQRYGLNIFRQYYKATDDRFELIVHEQPGNPDTPTGKSILLQDASDEDVPPQLIACELTPEDWHQENCAKSTSSGEPCCTLCIPSGDNLETAEIPVVETSGYKGWQDSLWLRDTFSDWCEEPFKRIVVINGRKRSLKPPMSKRTRDRQSRYLVKKRETSLDELD